MRGVNGKEIKKIIKGKRYARECVVVAGVVSYVYFVSRKNSDFFEKFFCEVCVNRQNNESGDLEWSPVSVGFRLVFIL